MAKDEIDRARREGAEQMRAVFLEHCSKPCTCYYADDGDGCSDFMKCARCDSLTCETEEEVGWFKEKFPLPAEPGG